jgi:hypothetical protein
MTTRSFASSSFLVSLLFCGVTCGAEAQVRFRDFRNTTGLNIIGGTTVEGNKIRLVPARRHSRGNVWTQKSFPVTGGFHASFDFRYTHQGGAPDGNGNSGNDGLLFYVQPVSNALQQNMEIPEKSLLLFFDGYKNQDRDDVSSSRLEVRLNGKRLGQTDVEAFGVKYRESKLVRVSVEYDGTRLTIALNDRQVVVYSNVDLSDASPGYVGFHGMGGDAYADVYISSFTFEPMPSRNQAKVDGHVAREPATGKQAALNAGEEDSSNHTPRWVWEP